MSGRSVSALSTLGVPTGDQIEVSASGRQAREALAAIAALGAAELRRAGDRRRRGSRDERRGSDRGVARHRHRAQDLAPGHRRANRRARLPARPAAETERLHAAFEAARAELSSTRDHVARAAGAHEAEIFDAHLLLLDDDELVGTALEIVASDPVAAEHAWRVAVDALAAALRPAHRPLPPVPGRRTSAPSATKSWATCIGHAAGTDCHRSPASS